MADGWLVRTAKSGVTKPAPNLTSKQAQENWQNSPNREKRLAEYDAKRKAQGWNDTKNPDGSWSSTATAGTPSAMFGGPAVPAPTAAPTGADDPYLSAYNSQIQAARNNIEQQFKAAIGSLQSRGASMQSMAGALPGKYNNIYEPTKANLDQYAGQTQAAQNASGLQAFAPAGAGLEPIKAAMDQNLASRQADVPVLTQAISAAIAGKQAEMEMSKADRLTQLDAESRQGLLSQMAGDKDFERQKELMAYKYNMENGGEQSEPLQGTPEWFDWAIKSGAVAPNDPTIASIEKDLTQGRRARDAGKWWGGEGYYNQKVTVDDLMKEYAGNPVAIAYLKKKQLEQALISEK